MTAAYSPGPTQKAILRAVAGGRAYLAVRPSHVRSCLKLHAWGYLDRDPKDARKFHANEKGKTWIATFDANFGRKAK